MLFDLERAAVISTLPAQEYSESHWDYIYLDSRIKYQESTLHRKLNKYQQIKLE